MLNLGDIYGGGPREWSSLSGGWHWSYSTSVPADTEGFQQSKIGLGRPGSP